MSTFSFSNLNITSDNPTTLNVGTGGFAGASPIGTLVENWGISAASGQGNNTALTSTSVFVTAIWVPTNMTITNISVQVGTTGGTDKWILALFNSAGTPVANTLLSPGTTAGTANNTQTIALTAPYAAIGPAVYYVGLYSNGTTATVQTVPANVGAGLFCSSITGQTFGTVAAITPPATFTANKAPLVWLS